MYKHGTYEYIAYKNLQSARLGMLNKDYDVCCFYGQQACEKFLKSVILYRYKREDIKNLMQKHNLQAMARKLEDSDLLKLITSFSNLTNFYYETRYPGDEFHDCSEEDAKLALVTAESVASWYESIHDKIAVKLTKEFI